MQILSWFLASWLLSGLTFGLYLSIIDYRNGHKCSFKELIGYLSFFVLAGPVSIFCYLYEFYWK